MDAYNYMTLQPIIFIDIETAPVADSVSQMSEGLQHIWNDKVESLNSNRSEEDRVTAEDEFKNAGLQSEFGRIVCISVGIVTMESSLVLNTKSFYGTDEKELLTGFLAMVESMVKRHRNISFCGHNLKSFDMPFICRRLMINGLNVPESLYKEGAKPWEVNWIDTMTMWQFSDSRHFTSLKLLCALFDIPTPKDDIDGSEVRRVFYEEKDYDRIATYCEKDVKATAQVYMKMKFGYVPENIKFKTFTPQLMNKQ